MGNTQAKLGKKLLTAVTDDKLDEVKRLLENETQIDINFKFEGDEVPYNQQGWTVLHHAAALQRVDIIEYFGQLLKNPNKTANINPHFYQPAKHGETPLYCLLHAKDGCKLDAVRVFLEADCRLDRVYSKADGSPAKDDCTGIGGGGDCNALRMAIKFQHEKPEILRHLIDVAKKQYSSSSDENFEHFINRVDSRGLTLLAEASKTQGCSVDILKMLVDAGACVFYETNDTDEATQHNNKNNKKKNILLEAAPFASKEIFDFLVDKIIQEKDTQFLKENIIEDSQTSPDGQNPLLNATEWKNVRVVEFLITDDRCKSDINYRRKKDGKGVMELAQKDLNVAGMIPNYLKRKKETIAYLEGLMK